MRKLLDLIGKAGVTAHGIRRQTGIDFDKHRPKRLRDGELEHFSDNMLLLLYEGMGGKVTLTLH